MALGVRKKVISLLELCRKHGITLNPKKFCISRKIELGGFKISSTQENPTPMIRPTQLSVKKILEFKEPQDKRQVQRFLGLVNTLRHWSNKFNSNIPNIRSLVTKDATWTWNETHNKSWRQSRRWPARWTSCLPMTPRRQSTCRLMAPGQDLATSSSNLGMKKSKKNQVKNGKMGRMKMIQKRKH